MAEQRNDTRYQTGARAVIDDYDEGEILLKDISVTGCRVECSSCEEIKLNTEHSLRIIPESIAGVDAFSIKAESKWIRVKNYSFEVGFFILESPKKKDFQRYVDYLSWRYSHGSSMIGDGRPENSPIV
jgi:hypothetical protein